MDLEGIDFTGCDLSGSEFRGRNLKGATFAGAILADCDLTTCTNAEAVDFSSCFGIDVARLPANCTTLADRMSEWLGRQKGSGVRLELLYRASRDGFRAADFHTEWLVSHNIAFAIAYFHQFFSLHYIE
jgi:uncharacterized protein YjbI with pentapeptide repeats